MDGTMALWIMRNHFIVPTLILLHTQCSNWFLRISSTNITKCVVEQKQINIVFISVRM